MLFNEIVKVGTATSAWDHWYNKIVEDFKKNENVHESRDGSVIGEVINAITVLEDPTRNVVSSNIRNMSMRYALGELCWYLSGKNTLDGIRLYTSNWDRMSDDGVTVNSNYGYCIKEKFGFNQWEMIKSLLNENPNSRQAVVHIKEPRNIVVNKTKDLNCTVCLQFFIREDKLYMTTYMRSNDLWMGFPYDIFQFTIMQNILAMELGIGLGSYTHIAGSLHLYKRDYEKSLGLNK